MIYFGKFRQEKILVLIEKGFSRYFKHHSPEHFILIFSLFFNLVFSVLKIKKSEPTILKSQSTRHGTTYHIAIYTGHRGGSGSTAIPALIISGQENDTQALILKNDGRKLFDRGSVETFLFTTNTVCIL